MFDRTPQERTIREVTYGPGRKFRVVKEGGRLSGWKADGPSSARGWSQVLSVGDVIVCEGVGFGWGSDPGYGVHWKVEEPGVGRCEFWPSTGGAFSYGPPEGFLEPVEEEVA